MARVGACKGCPQDQFKLVLYFEADVVAGQSTLMVVEVFLNLDSAKLIVKLILSSI